VKSRGSLILLLVRLVFSRYEFLVVFRQVRVWDRKSAGRSRVRVKPIARISQQGAKTTRWATFFKYNIGCTQKTGNKHEMEGTYFIMGVGGGGTTGLPAGGDLVCVRSVRGASGQDFSNSCRGGQKISTLTGPCCEKAAALDKSSDPDLCQPHKHLFCCAYFPVEISTKLNRYFYHCSSITYYIHYFVFLVVQGRDSSTK